ncbi:MAG: tetratricopeptide repeat protein [Vicinamibacterales bacterium]
MARLRRIGAFFATDLQVTWLDEAGVSHFLAPQRLPPAAAALGVSLDLYLADPSVAARGLRLRLEVRSEADGAPAGSWTLEPSAVGDHRQFSGRVPLEGLSAGRYELAAILIEDDQPVGTLSTTFARSAPPELAGRRPLTSPRAPDAAEGTAEDVLSDLAREAREARRPFDVPVILAPALLRHELDEVARSSGEVLPLELWDVSHDDGEFWDSLVVAGEAETGVVPAWARGVSALRRREGRVAVAALELALLRAPASTGVSHYLGAAYAVAGRDLDALVAWQLSDIAGAAIEWHLALADANTRLGARPQALALLTRALERVPDSPEVLRRLVEAHLAESRTDAASAHLRRLLEVSPYDADARWWELVLAYAAARAEASPGPAAAAFVALASRFISSDESRSARAGRWLRFMRAVG